jgi:hypothetical protein
MARVRGLPDHAEADVCRCRGNERLGAFEGDRRGERAEQRRAGTEQDRDDVHADLVDQAERECLLHDGRAMQADGLVARDVLGLLDRAGHAVGDEISVISGADLDWQPLIVGGADVARRYSGPVQAVRCRRGHVGRAPFAETESLGFAGEDRDGVVAAARPFADDSASALAGLVEQMTCANSLTVTNYRCRI